jgi:cytidine deaminase
MNDDLQDIASSAQLRAYSPYSNFLVGAALLSASGRIFAGCNVENVSLGLTLWAERVCGGMAVAQEERHYKMGDSRVPIVPGGACQRVLAEFAPCLRSVAWTLAGVRA